MPTRPGDWSALGLSGDPVPGDPAMLNTVADTMRDLATSAGVVNTGLRELQTTAGDGQRFIGVTADRLREMVDSHLYNFVGHVEESFRKAENAIRVYATAVETAQGEADQALSTAQGLPEDDPQRQSLTQRAEDARTDVSNAAGELRRQLHDAGAMMVQPVSDCDLFWEAFQWLTIIISVIAVFTGGILGIIAWGMNAVLLIKTIVDFSQGKASGLELGLAFLGVLFPTTKAINVGAIIKGLGNGLKGAVSGLTGAGRGLFGQISHFSSLTGLPKIVVAPMVIGAHLAPLVKIDVIALGKGFGNALKGGWNSAIGAIGSDWARVTASSTGAWAKTGAYSLANLQRLARLGAATLLPLNFTELSVLGIGGAARLAFGERVLGIAQPELHALLANAGRTDAALRGIPPVQTGPGALAPTGLIRPPGAFLPGGGLHLGGLGTGTLGAVPLTPLTELPTVNLGALTPQGLGASHGLTTAPLPHGMTTSPGGLVVPAAHAAPGGQGLQTLHQMDFAAGQVRLDNNLLLPGNTAIDLLRDAHTPSSVSHTGQGSVPGVASAGGVSDGVTMARGAVGHAEALNDLTFPELNALAHGDVAVTAIRGDGITLRIGDAAPRTVDAHTLAGTAPVPAGAAAAPASVGALAATPPPGVVGGVTATPPPGVVGAHAPGAAHTAAVHGGAVAAPPPGVVGGHAPGAAHTAAGTAAVHAGAAAAPPVGVVGGTTPGVAHTATGTSAVHAGAVAAPPPAGVVGSHPPGAAGHAGPAGAGAHGPASAAHAAPATPAPTGAASASPGLLGRGGPAGAGAHGAAAAPPTAGVGGHAPGGPAHVAPGGHAAPGTSAHAGTAPTSAPAGVVAAPPPGPGLAAHADSGVHAAPGTPARAGAASAPPGAPGRGGAAGAGAAASVPPPGGVVRAPEPLSAAAAHDLAMDLLRGERAAPPPPYSASAAGGLGARSVPSAGGVSARGPLDAAGSGGAKGAGDALDLVAHPGRPPETTAPHTKLAETGETAVQPPPPYREATADMPPPYASPPPGKGRFGGLSPMAAINQRIRETHQLIMGGTSGSEAATRLNAWASYERALSDLGKAERQVELTTPPPGQGGSRGPSAAQLDALDKLGAVRVRVDAAESRLDRLGIDPRGTRRQMQAITVQMFHERGGLPGGSRHSPSPSDISMDGTPPPPSPETQSVDDVMDDISDATDPGTPRGTAPDQTPEPGAMDVDPLPAGQAVTAPTGGSHVWPPPGTVPGGATPAHTMVNDAFMQLTNGGHAGMTGADYMTWVRAIETQPRELGFVVTAIVRFDQLGDGLQGFLNALTHRLNGFDGRIGVVIGVNGSHAQLPAIRQAIADALGQTTFGHPLALVATPLGPYPAGHFIYGTARNLTLDSQATHHMIRSMMADNLHPYHAIMDFDNYPHLVPGGQHVFEYWEGALKVVEDGYEVGNPLRPLMMAGGYRAPELPPVGSADRLIDDTRARLENLTLKERKNPRPPLEDMRLEFIRRIEQDMRIRDRLTGLHPQLAYGPEPNLFVDAAATLLTDDLIRVRFGLGGAEFGELSERLNRLNAWELDQSLRIPSGNIGQRALDELRTLREMHAANNTLPHRGVPYLTRFREASTETDLSRLMKTWYDEGKLPQDHAGLKNPLDRLFSRDALGAGQNSQAAREGIELKPVRDSFKQTIREGNWNDPLWPVHHPPGELPSSRLAADLSAALDDSLGIVGKNRVGLAVSARVPGDGRLFAGIDPEQMRLAAQSLALSHDEGYLARHLAYFNREHLTRGQLPTAPGTFFHALQQAARATGDLSLHPLQMMRNLVGRAFQDLRQGGANSLGRMLDQINAAGVDVERFFPRLVDGRLHPPTADFATFRAAGGALAHDPARGALLTQYAAALGRDIRVTAGDGTTFTVEAVGVAARNRRPTLELTWNSGPDGSGWSAHVPDQPPPRRGGGRRGAGGGQDGGNVPGPKGKRPRGADGSVDAPGPSKRPRAAQDGSTAPAAPTGKGKGKGKARATRAPAQPAPPVPQLPQLPPPVDPAVLTAAHQAVGGAQTALRRATEWRQTVEARPGRAAGGSSGPSELERALAAEQEALAMLDEAQARLDRLQPPGPGRPRSPGPFGGSA
ncbi:putative T7SS-secreted protein [Streptomyces milbemycinicus]|uniref:putative T7SS-secreted protein n=1 Tax=Streptomyces milbemycinicus TaxID=476552 RepID=UPI0033C4B2B2